MTNAKTAGGMPAYRLKTRWSCGHGAQRAAPLQHRGTVHEFTGSR